MTRHYTYESILSTAQEVNWKIEDIIGADRPLDFARPFMPESLARSRELAFLTPAEQLKHNQIRGCGYLYTFGLVEEFILPFVMEHAMERLHDDDFQVRALLQFAGEEAKHIQLFKTFYDTFTAGFGTPCAMIGPADEISQAVLGHHPLAVGMVTLHIEWMTQKHYTEGVRDDHGMDAQFKSLLTNHWAEEMQHAMLDTLIVEELARRGTAEDIDQAFDDFLKIATLLDGGLMQQVEFDLASLQTAIGRTFTDEECEAYRKSQQQAIRYTYLGSGLVHPQFLGTMEKVRPGSRDQLLGLAPAFS